MLRLFFFILYILIIVEIIIELPYLALSVAIVIIFLIIFNYIYVLFKNPIDVFMDFFSKLFTWLIKSIVWLLFACIPLWMLIEAFKALSMPISSMPLGGLIIIIILIVMATNEK